MTKPGLPSVPSLPWDRAAEEEKLFRVVLILIALLFFGLLFTLPKIPVPDKERAQVEEIPPRLAKLIMEKQEPPPPPPPEPEPEEPEPEPEPEDPEPEPEPEEPKPEEPEPKPEPKPEPTAKERAQAAIAVFDDLSDLRDTSDLADLAGEQKTLGSSATEASVERSLIGTSAIGGSGGVSTSKASSGGGGSGNLAGVAATKVESDIEEADLQQATRERQGSTKRSDENIELVFDRNKGSINALYRRALRQNPTLEGTLVLKLEIQPDGSVTKCEVVSSELDDDELERKIVLKVRRMNFGSQSVEVWQGTHRLNFFPS